MTAAPSQLTGKLTDLGPLRPPAMTAPGWPVWKTPAAVERGRPEQAFTEGAAVRAVIEALSGARNPDDLCILIGGNLRTWARVDPIYRQLLDVAVRLRAAELDMDPAPSFAAAASEDPA